ncbi:MAG: hypothetical protein II292_01840 [Clostridia bacterium]|nr:hypothetical protein [Clostridia bacterium]
MKTVKIRADLWHLTPLWAVAGTRGSFGSCRLEFDLSPQWAALCKRVTFFPAGSEDGVVLCMQGNSVIVPDEVMARAGTAFFVLDGTGLGGESLVSSRGELRVVDTATPGGREAKKRTPSEFDQLRAEIAFLRREIENMKRGA